MVLEVMKISYVSFTIADCVSGHRRQHKDPTQSCEVASGA